MEIPRVWLGRAGYLSAIAGTIYAYIFAVLGHHVNFDITHPSFETYSTYGILASYLAAVGFVRAAAR